MIRVLLQPNRMNRTEAAYDAALSIRKLAGEIRSYYFQAVTIRLGDDCRYTPDFVLVMKDWTLEAHEVKGFWRDDAKVKIKAAASLYPCVRFCVVQARSKKNGGGFSVEPVKSNPVRH